MRRLDDRKEWLLFWFIAWILVALALLQIGRIFWDPDTPIIARTEPVAEETDASMIQPQTIYISLKGQSGFIGVPEGTGDYVALLEKSLLLLSDVMPASVPVTEADVPLLGTVCCLDLETVFGSEVICSQMSVPENRFPEGSFDQIWILPARSLTEDVKIYYYNSHTGALSVQTGGAYRLESNLALLQSIVELCSTVDSNYVWQNTAYGDVFSSDGFLRTEGKASGARGKIESAFQTSEGISEMRMRRYAMGFFDYPDTVTEKPLGEDLLLSNEKMTVRLSPDGHLLYVETLTGDEKAEVTLYEAYCAADAFIGKDMAGQSGPSVKLVRYEKAGNTYVFYFEYVIDGYLCALDPDLAEEWKMPSSVVVTVEGGKVRRYERYVAQISLGQVVQVRYDWKDIVDRCAREGIELSEPPRLSYKMSRGQLWLVWELVGEDMADDWLAL